MAYPRCGDASLASLQDPGDVRCELSEVSSTHADTHTVALSHTVSQRGSVCT